MTLVDTNILFDLVTRNTDWLDWSLHALGNAAVAGPVSINAVIYAELSVRYETLAEVDNFLEVTGIQVVDLSNRTAFLAAKAYSKYRLSGGTKTGVLSDFFIGAHAQALSVPLLTRDVRRYRTYFPEVRLIAPHMN
ncbi:type II toxin-antitoxin system VapC family toxin [Mesorhizobium sp. CN5-321]|uniref:type II toxin-antitoxin system VapC family toxin n=1 Tax=Mesorhizobium hunchu TaxID=3157708 RepID=UPI0032B86156